MLQGERERECVQALSHDDQVRMAKHALNGWHFSIRIDVWRAEKKRWFDQYGTSLLDCLDRIDHAIVVRRFEPYDL